MSCEGDAILNEWIDWASECQTRVIIDSGTTYPACVYIPIPANISPSSESPSPQEREIKSDPVDLLAANYEGLHR